MKEIFDEFEPELKELKPKVKEKALEIGAPTIGPAVIAHEDSTLLVVFNGLRLLGYKYKI